MKLDEVITKPFNSASFRLFQNQICEILKTETTEILKVLTPVGQGLEPFFRTYPGVKFNCGTGFPRSSRCKGFCFSNARILTAKADFSMDSFSEKREYITVSSCKYQVCLLSQHSQDGLQNIVCRSFTAASHPMLLDMKQGMQRVVKKVTTCLKPSTLHSFLLKLRLKQYKYKLTYYQYYQSLEAKNNIVAHAKGGPHSRDCSCKNPNPPQKMLTPPKNVEPTKMLIPKMLTPKKLTPKKC